MHVLAARWDSTRRYIYINSNAGSVIAARRPNVWAYVSDNHRALTSDYDGAWFRRLQAPK
jgi:hypothetical protein